ncbi:MAG TPA: CocE/NonD family hydrolase [Actinomycetota bacterium]|nr:CocE/NonD family hydrolase [Actinomycetota bacterium]
MTRLRRASACLIPLVLGVMVVAIAPASGRTPLSDPIITAGPPADYTKIKGLSQPRYKTVRDSYQVEMADGVKMYVEVERPKAPGRFATILELSPYHGTLADRKGTRILPGPKDASGQAIGLSGYFAPRGYAVVFADLRGTGRSEGCLDHMGPNDQSDAKTIVEWAAKQKWSNGRVGMTGHSYVGSTPQMAASQNPKGLVTIVPSAGLAAMYHHEFQLGVPYWLQWAGPLFAYEQLAMERYLPGEDNFGGDPRGAACGWTQSAAVTGEAYFSGAETSWHVERDFRKGAARSKIPMFLVHGINDNAARVAATDWFVWRDGPRGDKAWIGQWDHGSGRHPNSRTCLQSAREQCTDDQWTAALHAWFDKHLQQRNVKTGPAAEVFLNDGTVFTSPEWPPPTSKLKLFPAEGGALDDRPADEGESSYIADTQGFNNEFRTGHVAFETAPVKRDMLIAGVPKMHLSISVTSPRIHVIPSLYDVKGTSADRIGQSFCAVNPELRNGIGKPAPVIPGEVMEFDIECQPQAHLLEKGHKLRLIVASSHPDKVPTFAAGARVTVYSGGEEGTSLTLPVIYDPHVYKDPYSRTLPQ